MGSKELRDKLVRLERTSRDVGALESECVALCQEARGAIDAACAELLAAHGAWAWELGVYAKSAARNVALARRNARTARLWGNGVARPSDVLRSMLVSLERLEKHL